MSEMTKPDSRVTDFSKHKIKKPYWLKIQSQPEKSVKEIYELGLDLYDFNGLDYSLNK